MEDSEFFDRLKLAWKCDESEIYACNGDIWDKFINTVGGDEGWNELIRSIGVEAMRAKFENFADDEARLAKFNAVANGEDEGFRETVRVFQMGSPIEAEIETLITETKRRVLLLQSGDRPNFIEDVCSHFISIIRNDHLGISRYRRGWFEQAHNGEEIFYPPKWLLTLEKEDFLQLRETPIGVHCHAINMLGVLRRFHEGVNVIINTYKIDPPRGGRFERITETLQKMSGKTPPPNPQPNGENINEKKPINAPTTLAKLSHDQCQYLYTELTKDHTGRKENGCFLHKNTKQAHFNYVFGGGVCPDDFDPLRWGRSKTALAELVLLLLGGKSIPRPLQRAAALLFVNKQGEPIGTLSTPKIKQGEYSEYYRTIETIVNGLNPQQSK
ncbi:MAG: hypothetical protein FWE10_07460 [Rikenellaceae bacterium]|nr:hypothetical protein [Rikenellaceae bacterium]